MTQWNPYTPGYFEDPYPHLHACMTSNPVQQGVHGAWMLFRHADVSAAINHPDLMVSELSEYFRTKESYIFKDGGCPVLHSTTRLWPMYLNGQLHTQIRGVLARAIAEVPISEVIRLALADVLDEYHGKESFDLVDFTSSYIYRIVGRLFRIDQKHEITRVKRYCNLIAKCQDVFVSRQQYQEINEAMIEGRNLFTHSEYYESIHRHATAAGMELNDDDLYSIGSVSLMAAFETSKDSLALAFIGLCKHGLMEEDFSGLNSQELGLLIEELFRFTSTLQYTIRVAQNDWKIGDVVIPAQSKMYLCLASANRDPVVFENPDQIVPSRAHNPHFSFGGGRHFCLGAGIARQEMKECLVPMQSFLRGYKLQTSDIQWSRQIFMRTASSVSVNRI